MAFSKVTGVSAENVVDLLTEIDTFTTADGWTQAYDDIAGGSPDGAQLGISIGNCFLSIGERTHDENPIDRSDLYNGGTVEDAKLFMVVNHSLDVPTETYWGHPDGTTHVNLVGNNSSSNGAVVQVNDLAGEGSNYDAIWLFSDRVGGGDGTYVHVVVQQDGDRFTTFGFGNLDKKGMSHPDVGFCYGMGYLWWPNHATVTSQSHNNPESLNHKIGILGERHVGSSQSSGGGSMLFLKDTTLDPTLGFKDDDHQTVDLMMSMIRGWEEKDHSSDIRIGNMLDFFLSTGNQLTTGGVPLFGFPAVVEEVGLKTYVGEYPGIRLVNMGNLIPGQDIMYGSETWTVFPFKRKGTRAATNQGGGPLPFVNSIEYGFAIRKITA